jgi:cytoskeletal protein RodZ
MSQKKVDAYKSRKGQRNKADRKEKVLFGLEMFAWVFICVVIVAWIGYSAYVKVTGAKADVVQNTVMDTTALDNYISNLSANTSDDADGADTDSADADSTDNAADVSETESSDTDAADKAEVEDNTATADDKETSDDASAETTDDAATADADSTDAK